MSNDEHAKPIEIIFVDGFPDNGSPAVGETRRYANMAELRRDLDLGPMPYDGPALPSDDVKVAANLTDIAEAAAAGIPYACISPYGTGIDLLRILMLAPTMDELTDRYFDSAGMI
jgi:hypothetical protein